MMLRAIIGSCLLLLSTSLFGHEPVSNIPGGHPGYTPPTSEPLFSKPAEELKRGHLFVGPLLQQGQSRPSGGMSPIPTYAYGLELGYAKQAGAFGEKALASVALSRGKLGGSEAVFDLQFRSLMKLGYGYQINSGVIGVFFAQAGFSIADYSNKLSNGSVDQSMTAPQSFIYGFGYQGYFDALERLWITGGVSWNYYNFYVPDIINSASDVVTYPKLSLGFHVVEVLVGVFYKV